MAKRRASSQVYKRWQKAHAKRSYWQIKNHEFDGPVITRQATPEELERMRARVAAKRQLPSS